MRPKALLETICSHGIGAQTSHQAIPGRVAYCGSFSITWVSCQGRVTVLGVDLRSDRMRYQIPHYDELVYQSLE